MTSEIKDILENNNVCKLIKSSYLEKSHNELFCKINTFKQVYYKDVEISFSQLVYNYSHEIKELPKCECGKSRKFKSFSEGYRQYCSVKCSSNSFEKQKKITETCLKKYGETNISCVEKIKEKKKESFQQHYKKDHIWSKKEGEVRSCNITCLERYGVDNVFKLNETQKKIKIFKTSKIEEEIIKILNTHSFNFKHKNYDFKIENDIFEIDGDYYHPSKIENLSFIQLNNVLNDFRKAKNLENTEYKLYRIYISNLPNNISVENLKNNSYVPTYKIKFDDVILSKEYLTKYKTNKSVEKLNNYVSLLVSFCKEVCEINLSEEFLKRKIEFLFANEIDVSLKNITKC